MNKLNAEMAAFFAEIYTDGAKPLVFGAGDATASVMLIGEAPGAQEALEGRPFVGKAGKNLDEFLALSGIDRERLYITNTVKFRPAKRSEAGRMVNRAPTAEEIKLFLPWLHREIAAVRPRCIVTLGNVPLKALWDPKATVGQWHGQFLAWQGVTLYPLYHPASLIYTPSLRETYQADVRALGAWAQVNDLKITKNL